MFKNLVLLSKNTIFANMERTNNFTPSVYQQKIFDFVKNGQGNLVIEAVAGAGKTTTIIKCLELLPPNKRILFSAFNRSIVQNLKTKIPERKGLRISTLHGLGYDMLKWNYADDYALELDEYKYSKYIRQNLNPEVLKTLSKRKQVRYPRNIIKLVDFGRYYLADTVKKMTAVATRYGIDILADEINAALEAIEWGKKNLNTIDYTDMVFLPNALFADPRAFLFDYIFLDEVQDLNKAQRLLFQKCCKINTRFFACGDKNQCIYSFSGSDPDSFDELTKLPNTTKKPLAICYRCADAIVSLAQTKVSEIEQNYDKRPGTIENNVSLNKIQDGDLVLCRNNAPLANIYMSFLRRGRKCYIAGKDIGENLKNLIADTGATELVDDNGEGVLSLLYEDLIDLKQRLMSNQNLDEHSAVNSSIFLEKFDRIKVIEILSENCATLEDLYNRIDEVFSDETKEGVMLSTVHKAKGLEADKVFIACKSLMPSKSAKLPWEIIQEDNLLYVAYTRAKNYLGFIREDTVRPTILDEDLNTLKRIEKSADAIKSRREYRQSGTAEYAPIIISKTSAPITTMKSNGTTLGKKTLSTGLLPKKKLTIKTKTNNG